jgi:hypothetical protein
MKHFKELVNELQESEYFPGHYQHARVAGAGGRSAHDDLGSYRIELDEIVGRINAFIREYTDREFIDPTSLRNQLKVRLNHVGLDFECDSKKRLGEGNFVFPVSRFGGSFGTTPEHDLLKNGFKKSDMIEEFAGTKMVLEFKITRNESSMYVVDARLRPGEATGE